MAFFGKLIHYSVDAVLLSSLLASVRRNTGLQVKTDNIESGEIRNAINKYLNVGEWVIDQSTAFMSTSAYFEKKR
ncbi:DUF1748-domain-containing protein [Ascobolus immersus RN42]|uniref:DUF1748-domain-containing protein n=1 Tax=Ascobolus immersus RN42 TaxID=1160509 RepID=A0A3N4ID70_ASCIM|nr:DUF1748-domain-containing protein [Ascobolus immersus RN42]